MKTVQEMMKVTMTMTIITEAIVSTSFIAAVALAVTSLNAVRRWDWSSRMYFAEVYIVVSL